MGSHKFRRLRPRRNTCDGTTACARTPPRALADPGERIAYRSSPRSPDGSNAFTARVEYVLAPSDGGTELALDYRITDSTVEGADFVAGIETGVGQTLDALAAALTTYSPGGHAAPPSPPTTPSTRSTP